MKRKTCSRWLATTGLAACLGASAFGQGVRVEVNGQSIYFQGARPQMMGGRVMVPLRGVLEELGAYVSWDQSLRMVTARKGATDISMRIGDRTAQVNGRTMYLDAPARIIQGTTLVPLRFMSEALGADVDWIAQTNTVRINTYDISEPPNFPPNNPPTYPPPTTYAAISSFTVDAPYATLRAGDMVHMEVHGNPGADVSFSIPGITDTKRMREESPGVYTADWTVSSAANGLNESAIVAKLIYRGDTTTARAPNDPRNAPPARDAAPPIIMGMEPSNASNINQLRPMIRVRVSDDDSGLNLDSWKLWLDDEEVTDQAGYSNGMVTYLPPNRLSRGLHTVKFSIEDRAGNRASTSWQFRTDRDNNDRWDRRSATFTHNAPATLREGDEITFTVRAEPSATVTYSIGNIINDRIMTETTPGVYTARYTIRQPNRYTDLPVIARVRLDDGTSYTIQADRLLYGTSFDEFASPTITSPSGTRVGNSIIVRANSRNADRYEVKVDYVSTVIGGLKLNGTILQRTYDAEPDGELRTESIDLDVPVGGSDVVYTITVTAVSENGTRSKPATLTVRR